MDKFNFISGVHSDLSKKPFLTMDYGTTEGGTGHVGFLCHKQPVMEKAIRDVIQESSFCELRPGSTVVSITEDENLVRVGYENASGTRKGVRAKFLIGADGKTGFTRKKYLEPKGIILERCHQYALLLTTPAGKTTDLQQNIIRRDLGSIELADLATNSQDAPRRSTLGLRVHASRSLRSGLPN